MNAATPLIALPWIAWLRLGLALAVGLLVSVAHFWLGFDLPWVVMLVIAGGIAAVNWLLTPRAEAARRWISAANLVGVVFVLDIVALTVLLALSGGASNPFSLLYLVQITLSATILTKRWTWFLGLLATICFGLLFVAYRPVPELSMRHQEHGTSLHLIGMWVAFAVAAFLVALFSGKVSELMWTHQVSLRTMQAELARKDRLTSLVTLAAGAAHELGTPLGTIAIVAKDLETYAIANAQNSDLIEDCRLIRSEVDRCRAILSGMSVQGAEPVGESLEITTTAQLLQNLPRELSNSGIEIDIDASAADAPLCLPVRAVRQAVLALLKNALEAGSENVPVRLGAQRDEQHVLILVTDKGHGMTEDQLRRIGEPFYTTKSPGSGMGLGVFLVRSLAEKIGARLSYQSLPAAGTTATLRIPIAH
jgi:two-component system, sensor histidine kinase RegB